LSYADLLQNKIWPLTPNFIRHHWAMDRFLIAPTPEGRWQVSNVLDARRSAGEADLLALHQRRVLLPGDEAFHPSAAGVEWRVQRLAA
jgi:putative restriction endonuclease